MLPLRLPGKLFDRLRRWLRGRALTRVHSFMTPLREAKWVAGGALRVAPFKRQCSCNSRHVFVGSEIPLLLEGVRAWVTFGIATDCRGRVIIETANSDYRLQRLVREGPLTRGDILRKNGEVVTGIEHGFMWDNYYHWLIDSLPRIFWLWDPAVREAVNGTVTLYVHRFARGPLRELVEAIVPDYVTIKECGPNSCIEASAYLHLPTLARDYCGWLPREYLQLFLSVVSSLWNLRDEGSSRCVYIMRRFATKRRVINEDELCRHLSAAGFECVAAEQMSLREQAQFFRNAKVVIAPHGAGLTNIIYAKDCTVIELFPGVEFGHYRELSRALGHRYQSFVCGTGSKNDDFEVAADLLREFLRKCRIGKDCP